MNREQLMSMVSAARGGEPVCRPVRLRSVGQSLKCELACCPFPADDADAMLRVFRAAPQFSGIDPEEVLRRSPDGVRAVLVSESAYDARQAAVYLAALSARARRDAADEAPAAPGDGELDRELEALLAPEHGLRDALAAVSASLLDPALRAGAEEDGPAAMAAAEKRLDAASVPAPALLVYAASGPVLSPAVAEQLEHACDGARDVFVALQPQQIDLALVDDLLFKQGFLLLDVLPATDAYLANVLRAAVAERHAVLSEDADPAAVVSHLRRLRGSRFDETDLYDAVGCAVRSAGARPLTTADLLYRPYRPRAGRRAWDELEGMTGLENVKAALRRQLAASVLRSRRGGEPMCRSLAFAGSPGTGKSVTARLVAEILREEGCGTGRFVEAGREQLIGRYVGHTSPKIARLFERARGGVLFIDEAGALIPDGGDSYAEEAVNALVRHMELEPETVVILATYADEMRRLLGSNPGLSSRVAQVLEFRDYTDGQLWSILDALTRKAGFALPADARGGCLAFFRALRARRGARFGNGREARRLRDAAIEELALRAMDDADAVLSAADLEAAAKRLLAQEDGAAPARRVGF